MILLLLAQTAQPDAAALAAANDRCMTTYAVRMTKTGAADEEIFATASSGCKELNDQLRSAIARDYSAEEAAQLNAKFDAQAKPNFIRMLARIRTDRASN